MSDCDTKDHLSALVDGDLAPEVERRVRDHLQQSDGCGCSREVEDLRGLVAALGRLPDGPVEPGGWKRLEAHLPRRWSRPLGLAWAALVILGAVVVAWTFLPRGPDGRDATRLPGAEVVHADLASLEFTDEQLVRYGSEIASVDSLIQLARKLPPGSSEVEKDLERLASLREDLLTEMILEAQARQVAAWE
jgi:Putative zinc-finger